VLATFGFAMASRILPLPPLLAAANPDWVLLVLIFWLLAYPDRIGLGFPWLVGLLTDVLTGRSLGQHALAYCLVAFYCIRFHNRLRFYSLVQQSVCIGLFLLLSQLIVAWTIEQQSHSMTIRSYGPPVLAGAVAWPLLLRLFHRWRFVAFAD
jgi:rod shape-determining protein MreD